VTGVSRLLEDAHGRCRGGMIEACWAGKLCTEGVEEDTAPSSTLCIALTLALVALFEVECIRDLFYKPLVKQKHYKRAHSGACRRYSKLSFSASSACV